MVTEKKSNKPKSNVEYEPVTITTTLDKISHNVSADMKSVHASVGSWNPGMSEKIWNDASVSVN